MLCACRETNDEVLGRDALRLPKLPRGMFRITLLLDKVAAAFIGRGTVWFAKAFAVRAGLLF